MTEGANSNATCRSTHWTRVQPNLEPLPLAISDLLPITSTQTGYCGESVIRRYEKKNREDKLGPS